MLTDHCATLGQTKSRTKKENSIDMRVSLSLMNAAIILVLYMTFSLKKKKKLYTSYIKDHSLNFLDGGKTIHA